MLIGPDRQHPTAPRPDHGPDVSLGQCVHTDRVETASLVEHTLANPDGAEHAVQTAAELPAAAERETAGKLEAKQATGLERSHQLSHRVPDPRARGHVLEHE